MPKYGPLWKRGPPWVLAITEQYKVEPKIRKLSRRIEVLCRRQDGVKEDVRNYLWKLLFTIDNEFAMEGALSGGLDCLNN